MLNGGGGGSGGVKADKRGEKGKGRIKIGLGK